MSWNRDSHRQEFADRHAAHDLFMVMSTAPWFDEDGGVLCCICHQVFCWCTYAPWDRLGRIHECGTIGGAGWCLRNDELSTVTDEDLCDLVVNAFASLDWRVAEDVAVWYTVLEAAQAEQTRRDDARRVVVAD